MTCDSRSLCDSCINDRCVVQHGIVRNRCDFYEAEINREKIIAELREVAQALNEFADNLERIEKKYAEPREREEREKDD